MLFNIVCCLTLTYNKYNEDLPYKFIRHNVGLSDIYQCFCCKWWYVFQLTYNLAIIDSKDSNKTIRN